jgi:Tfp pilus assembly protein PilF
MFMTISQQGNLAMAKSELFFVLSHDQQNTEAKYLVGQAMEKDGKLDEAKRLYHSILEKKNHTKTIYALKKMNHK